MARTTEQSFLYSVPRYLTCVQVACEQLTSSRNTPWPDSRLTPPRESSAGPGHGPQDIVQHGQELAPRSSAIFGSMQGRTSEWAGDKASFGDRGAHSPEDYDTDSAWKRSSCSTSASSARMRSPRQRFEPFVLEGDRLLLDTREEHATPGPGSYDTTKYKRALSPSGSTFGRTVRLVGQWCSPHPARDPAPKGSVSPDCDTLPSSSWSVPSPRSRRVERSVSCDSARNRFSKASAPRARSLSSSSAKVGLDDAPSCWVSECAGDQMEMSFQRSLRAHRPAQRSASVGRRPQPKRSASVGPLPRGHPPRDTPVSSYCRPPSRPDVVHSVPVACRVQTSGSEAAFASAAPPSAQRGSAPAGSFRAAATETATTSRARGGGGDVGASYGGYGTRSPLDAVSINVTQPLSARDSANSTRRWSIGSTVKTVLAPSPQPVRWSFGDTAVRNSWPVKG